MLKEYLPPQLFFIKEIQELIHTHQLQIDILNAKVQDLINQCFVNTATWGLDEWEEFVGIKTDISKDIELRRTAIIAKLRGLGTSTVDVIKNVAQSFVKYNQVEVIENNAEYEFIINFIYDRTIDLLGVENAIDVIKPAHLDYKLSITDQKALQIKEVCKEYPYPFFMCGTFLCGTKPYIANEGFKVNTTLKAETNNTNTKQKYNMAGTFESGVDKI